MPQYLTLLLTSACLLLSKGAYAHNIPFVHPETSTELVHVGMHLLVCLPLLTLAFFLGRWLLRAKTRRSPFVRLRLR